MASTAISCAGPGGTRPDAKHGRLKPRRNRGLSPICCREARRWAFPEGEDLCVENVLLFLVRVLLDGASWVSVYPRIPSLASVEAPLSNHLSLRRGHLSENRLLTLQLLREPSVPMASSSSFHAFAVSKTLSSSVSFLFLGLGGGEVAVMLHDCEIERGLM